MRVLCTLIIMLYSAVLFAEERSSIKVSAMSEIKVQPDEVVLQLAVHTRDKQLLTAKRENDKIAAAVLSLATTHSIPATNVMVTDLEASPDYGEYGRSQPNPSAYNFIRSIEVRLTDFKKIEPFLADAFDAGLSSVRQLQFRISNQRQHQIEARMLAVTYAKEKALHLTELTDMKLGPPLHIEEDVEHNWNAGGFGGSMGAVVPARAFSSLASNQTRQRFVSFQQLKEQASDALTAPGQIVITARVTIEFEMTK